MNNIYIGFEVGNFVISRTGAERITTNNRNFIYAKFNFSNVWDGLNKTVIFSKEGLDTVNIPIDNGACKIPSIFMEEEGTIKVSVFAGDLRTVDSVKIEVIESGYEDGGEPVEPEPGSIYVQSPNSSIPYIQYLDGNFQFMGDGEWKIILGWIPIFSVIEDNGRNVMKIIDWVDGTGTKPNIGFLGEDGIVDDISLAIDIRGIQGFDGPQGKDGYSAYQVAVNKGFVGTEEEWLESLIGKQGENFDPADLLRIDNLENQVDGLHNEITTNINIHNTNDTSHADIRLKIDETRVIAEGRSRAKVFATYEDMKLWLDVLENVATLNIGDNLFIIDVGVSDFWWDGTQARALETQKVDLTDYFTKDQINILLADKANRVDVEILQAEATAKWILLNTVDNRSRVNENAINEINNTIGDIGTILDAINRVVI